MANALGIINTNVHVPSKISKFTRAPSPWLTDNIYLMMKLRDSALRRYKKNNNIETENTIKCYKE